MKLLLFLIMLSVAFGLHSDQELSKSILTSIGDKFVLTFENLTPAGKSRLLTIDFGKTARIIFSLDRVGQQVLLETTKSGSKSQLRIPSKSITMASIHNSLAIQFDEARLSFYLDCEFIGTAVMSFALSDMMGMDLLANRDRRIKVIAWKEDLRKVLDDLDCPNNEEQNIQPSVNEVTYRRGDIPIFSPDEDRDTLLIKTIHDLIKEIVLLRIEVTGERSDIRSLRETLENCDMCKTRPPEPPRTGCAATPPPCFPRVQCRDEPGGGTTCGPCPRGYFGDGRNCRQGPTCLDRPCFQGVQCYDGVDGYQCGPCPQGYEGDGIRCTQRRRCESNPCYSG